MIKPTILVVDDEVTNLKYVAHLLKDQYDVKISKSSEDALSIVEQSDISLILLDIYMSEMDGYEVAKKLTNNPKTKNIPIIFLTADKNEDALVKGFDAGAQDFLTKPFNNKELTARVNTHIRLYNLVKEQKLLLKKIKAISLTDELTKVGNRKAFNERIDEMISEYQRYQVPPFCMLILDVDHFKSVNDTYGHQTGDEVLIALGNMMNTVARKTDHAYRFGGEEFVFLLSNTKLEDASSFAQKLRIKVQNEINIIENREITVSIGVAEYNKEDTLDTLIQRADSNLYKAKKSGKNQVISF